MFQTPTNAIVAHALRRSLFKAEGKPRNYLNDFNLRLYADDGSDAHNPGKQVSAR